jgi:hypothetical protein
MTIRQEGVFANICVYIYVFLYMRCGARKGVVVLVEDNFSAEISYFLLFHFPPGRGRIVALLCSTLRRGNEVEPV